MTTDLVLSDVTRRDVLDQCKAVIQRLNQDGNLRRANASLTALDSIADTAGLGKACLLSGMQKWYTSNNRSDEGFFSAIGMTETHKVTYARRLINLWGQIEKRAIPTDVQKRSVKELIPIANALSHDAIFDDDDWEEIRMAPNVEEIGRIIAKVRKTKQRANTLSLSLAPDGSIYAYKGNQRKFVGYLNLEEENDEIVAMAHNKIIDNTPIRRSQ